MEFKETVEGVLNLKIKKLKTNNGGKFTSHEFFSFCPKEGIKRKFFVWRHQNKRASQRERFNILWRLARVGCNLPKTLWAEGIACATYVINRVPLSLIDFKSPYELMFEEKPNVKHLKGSCYVHVLASQRS